MNVSTVKKAGAVIGAVAIASVGTAGTIPAFADRVMAIPQSEVIQTANVPHDCVTVAEVKGTFSYDQSVMSSRKNISEVFAKAAAVLCNAMPDYGDNNLAQSIEIVGETGTPFSTTVDEMAEEEGSHPFIMACACASNVAGGGAIVNAEVAGVSIESIMKKAGA